MHFTYLHRSMKSGGQSKVWSNGHGWSINNFIVAIVTLEYYSARIRMVEHGV